MDGYCIAGQAPVLNPPNPWHAAWLQRCAQAKAEREAADAQRRAEYLARNGYGPAAVTVQTREQRAAALRQEIAIHEQAMRSRDIAETWGRLTSADYSAQTSRDMSRVAELRAMLAEVLS